ncbi:hypothetical protein E3N88_15531 [Mikania micrantha]|uniref:J domain-containing protein n=1 Tax=Mikania micrantha TaxID=192012 RepID=A0A5N6NXH6_9ASTR|nr:hypothetical protein E3N88_15531 [Mikania micrantha]
MLCIPAKTQQGTLLVSPREGSPVVKTPAGTTFVTQNVIPAHDPTPPARNLTPPYHQRASGQEGRRGDPQTNSYTNDSNHLSSPSSSLQSRISLFEDSISSSCFSPQFSFGFWKFLQVFEMDQFGVLVESIGFKAHGKSSAPLADLKATNKANDNLNGFPLDIGINQSRSTYKSNTAIDAFDLDGIFTSSSSSDPKVPISGLDDVFGGSGYGDSVFRASSSNNFIDDDGVFGLMKTSSGASDVDHFDVLGNKVSPVMKTNSIDDLLGNSGGIGVESNNARGKQVNASNYNDLTGNLNANVMKSVGVKKNSVTKQETASKPADLLSDFGVNSSSLNGRKSEANPAGLSTKSFSASAEDPFVMFDRTQGSSYKENYGASVVDDYLDSLFSPGTSSNTTLGQSSTTEDSVYDDLFNNNVVPKPKNKASSVSSNNTKHAFSKANSTEDFSYLFGMGVAPSSSEFKEIEGESEERRKARYKHHMTTRDRMNNALNEKNKRDLQAQQEQDEKHMVAATLDGDIKRWAVGKEGNLRALLSSLQHILWAGCGWQPISLTDLITSTAVKKAYYKATLCVHPDKVQQKGATVQQKYIAEKVFDLLKESWNKFNAEEFKKH